MEPAQAERRRFRRYAVALDAQVRDGHLAGIAGRIRDLCLGGALFDCADNEWVKQVRQGRMLDLLVDLSGGDALSVSTRVVRVFGGMLGLKFETPSNEALAGLAHFFKGRLESGASSRPGQAATSHATEQAQRILQRITQQRGDEILEAWLQAMEEALWERADHAKNDVQRSQWGGGAVEFSRLRRHGAFDALVESLRKGLATKLEQAPAIPEAETDSLDLVDTERFETWLETSSLINHLEDDLAEPLKILQSQVRCAFGSDEGVDLLPARLAAAFEAWLDDHGLEGDVKRLGLSAGKRALPRLLGAYYRDLSRALEEVGFVPEDVDTARRSVIRASIRRRKDRNRQHGINPAAPQGCAGERSSAAEQAPGSRGELTAAKAADLLMALPHDALGDESMGSTGHSLKQQALELLSESRPEVAAQPLEPVLHERIDATDRVLKHMVANTATSSHIRQWINRLSLRVLAAAVADPDFFRHPGHPLMQLLGQLDHISMLLPAEGGVGESEVGGMIDQLVGQALLVDVRNQAAYGPILDQMGMLEQRCGEHFRQDAAREIERLEGQQRRRNAHANVQKELARRFGRERIHQVVAELVAMAWSTLLELRYLREGEAGQQLQSDWEVLDRLRALCGGESSGGAPESQGVDELEMAIMDGLSYVGFDPYLAKTTMKKIREAVRRQSAGLCNADEFVTFRMADDVAVETPCIEHVDREIPGELSRQLAALHLGATMRLRERGKESTLRLIWRSPDEYTFAFMDTNDGQVRELSRQSLVTELLAGRLRLRSWLDGAITDRALDATLREMQEHIHYHEARDALTGLYTHQQFTGRLAAIMGATAERESHVPAFLEIDHFDAVTCNCGYKAAEQLLQLVSELLRERLGDETFLAFLGGRRFGFILKSDDPESARNQCEAVRRDVYGLAFKWEGRSYPVTGSVGMVLMQPVERNPDVVLSSLDVACATAREAGGNRLIVFSDEDDSITRNKERLRWLSAVEDVVKNERIRLRVQTIAPINPHGGLHGHHEVLMRVYDGQGEELDLEHFIATAEAFHLMGEVDRLVIRKALSWGRDNPELLEGLGGVAVNLSGVSLSDPQLLAYIRAQLDHFQVSPQHVSFELTETAAIASLERALGIIEGIKDIGCRVALDDFGTGMSSYSYLKALPVDYVKIDGSFIKDVLTSPSDLAIVRAINEIAHFMGIKTIAEYVASEDIIERLDEIGVDFMQGYAVQRPQFLEDLRPPR